MRAAADRDLGGAELGARGRRAESGEGLSLAERPASQSGPPLPMAPRALPKPQRKPELAPRHYSIQALTSWSWSIGICRAVKHKQLF
eukprot:scaffold135584_cov33-Tisochrysis_lutea.AAC.3